MPLDPHVIWKTFSPSWDGSGGISPCQVGRDAQLQIVDGPAPGSKAIRCEVKFGDEYGGYSDARGLFTGPEGEWIKDGDVRYQHIKIMWPVNWRGSFPKSDELFQGGKLLGGGSTLINHHQPKGGGVERGSAPFYLSANDSEVVLDLVEQIKGADGSIISQTRPNGLKVLAPLVRGHWYDIVVGGCWSAYPQIGYLEAWVDGVQVKLGEDNNRFSDWTMYVNTEMYPVIGLYRRATIGDMKLLYPPGHLKAGQRVFPQDDGTPGVVYVADWRAGKTYSEAQGTPPATQPPPPPLNDPVKAETWRVELVDVVTVELDKQAAAIKAAKEVLDQALADSIKARADLQAILDKGR